MMSQKKSSIIPAPTQSDSLTAQDDFNLNTPALDPEQVQKKAQEIDLKNINTFGADVQKKLEDGIGADQDADFQKRGKDAGKIGENLKNLQLILQSHNPTQKKNLFQVILNKFHVPGKHTVLSLAMDYQQVGTTINQIKNSLQTSRDLLKQDNHKLYHQYQESVNYYRNLELLIAAGQQRLQEVEQQLAQLKDQADTDALAGERYKTLFLQKKALALKVYNFQRNQNLILTQLTEIRVTYANNEVVISNVDNSLSNQVPLWKSGMHLAMALQRQKEVIAANKAMNEASNAQFREIADLVKENNANALKAEVDTAADMDTIKYTIHQLQEVEQQVMDISQESRRQLENAEQETQQCQTDLLAIVNRKNEVL